MIEKECVTLEDGIEYIIVDTIEKFLYLVNINDPKDFCIRKQTIENNKKYISGLDNKEEFEMALKLFEEKFNKKK